MAKVFDFWWLNLYAVLCLWGYLWFGHKYKPWISGVEPKHAPMCNVANSGSVLVYISNEDLIK